MSTALRFKKLDPNAIIPSAMHEGDAGYDISTPHPFVLRRAHVACVRTGFAVEIPPGHAGLILPRSGLCMEHGITVANAPGLIDSGYRGELSILLVLHYLMNTKDFSFDRGDRIAQLVIVKFENLPTVEVPELSTSERGDAGFGSTGVAA